jgi:hypothetical protein
VGKGSDPIGSLEAGYQLCYIHWYQRKCIPVHCYEKGAWFDRELSENWFYKHLVPVGERTRDMYEVHYFVL